MCDRAPDERLREKVRICAYTLYVRRARQGESYEASRSHAGAASLESNTWQYGLQTVYCATTPEVMDSYHRHCTKASLKHYISRALRSVAQAISSAQVFENQQIRPTAKKSRCVLDLSHDIKPRTEDSIVVRNGGLQQQTNAAESTTRKRNTNQRKRRRRR